MFSQATLKFLKDLSRNNQKEWFDTNRSRYDNAKKELEVFTGEIVKRVSAFDESIAHLQVKECIFRINRDIRFSKDKTPYKNHLSMALSKLGKKAVYPGYYFHLEPGNTHVAGGLWMPMAPELKKVRQEIDYNWEEFKKIREHKKFRSAFGDFSRDKEYVLSRAPKDYGDDNPAIEFLKLKSWVVEASLSDEQVLSKSFAKQVAALFETMHPMIRFFGQALHE